MRLNVDESAVKRIKELRTAQDKAALMLRVTVEGGGCSGFQYILEFTEDVGEKDIEFENAVVTDDISMPFLNEATVKFKNDLIGSEFVIDNPNAQSGCGCGTSFSMM